jgi:septal ring factor EnvC (AmiA/AmiB activator)
MIVDHGDQYLSIYAGNEALYKQAGQEVKGGEAIASVGNTLGVGESGLYFEMRYRGTPFDPLVWVK